MDMEDKEGLLFVGQQGPKRRRSSPRIPLKRPIHLRRDEDPEETFRGWMQDISAYGMAFLCENRVDVDSEVTLFMEEATGERAVHAIKAVVVRNEFELHHSNGLYEVGVKFMELDDPAREQIMEALQQSDIMALLRDVADAGASDLHLSAHHPPIIRKSGKLTPIGKELLPSRKLREMIYTLIDDNHRRLFEKDLELNFAISVDPTLRYRVNVHMQRGNVEAAFRRIQPVAKSFGQLNLPPTIKRFADLNNGLVLITGPTGAGKTTTAAAMVDYINNTRAAVIITLENPIEYMYAYKKSVIKQREIGVDSLAYPTALREAMRQDPDVIVIGEVRDEETMAAALDAAETGHLVIATFPAANAVQSILRTFHFFAKERQQEIQLQLANCLRGIVSLQLLPRADVPGVVPATEILTSTDAIANMIRTGSLEQVASAIQTGASYGMHAFSASIDELKKSGKIHPSTAMQTTLERSL